MLTVTEMLRKHGVVDKFVEFFGDGLANLPLADRATIANMSPEFGSTCAIFPIDEETLRYLKLSGRPAAQIQLVEDYAHAQGLWRVNGAAPARLHRRARTRPGNGRAQPRRPEPPAGSRAAARSPRAPTASTTRAWPRSAPRKNPAATGTAPRDASTARSFELRDGAVLIAAITSCTNTSNPYVLIAAGLLARNAHRLGLTRQALGQDQPRARLARGHRLSAARPACSMQLAGIGFNLVGYGCTTCIGNSGPLSPRSPPAIKAGDLIGCSVLSGNRNFDGRVHPEVQMNFLASPPLVVAYALAGTLDIDLNNEPLGTGTDGKPVYLRDIWPAPAEVADYVQRNINSEMFRRSYGSVFEGDERWQGIAVPAGQDLRLGCQVDLRQESALLRRHDHAAGRGGAIARRARAGGAGRFGHHRSHLARRQHRQDQSGGPLPDGTGRAAGGLQSVRRAPRQSRGDDARHLRQHPPAQPAAARHRGRRDDATCPSGEQMSIYDAAMRYKADGTPLIILAGKEYGTGSSRDWAAKGTMLLGVQAVIAESFERIHRSNLIGMGVLPLQFIAGSERRSRWG